MRTKFWMKIFDNVAKKLTRKMYEEKIMLENLRWVSFFLLKWWKFPKNLKNSQKFLQVFWKLVKNSKIRSNMFLWWYMLKFTLTNTAQNAQNLLGERKLKCMFSRGSIQWQNWPVIMTSWRSENFFHEIIKEIENLLNVIFVIEILRN